MEDKKSELLQYAREYATANKDLYELLSVSADAAQPEVHRAWRKASLKHHPDKAKNFDPEIWQLFERARDLLSLPEARAAYDSARAATLQAQMARAALDSKRRAMIDDLEARERGVKRKAGEETNGRHMMTEAEKRVLMEKGREHLEKRRRMKEEAEARERERDRARMEEDKNTARKAAERRPIQPDSAQIPTSTTTDTRMEDADNPRPPAADEYDERIADLERKLRERKAEKAARKAGKKGNKARTDENGPAGKATTILTATAENPPSPPKPIFTTQPPTSNPAPGDFSSTMAKLRAAQREKERKRAEVSAVTATASLGRKG
ncbi:hypothetical protein E0Z10_g3157 [Xylaria hypoxylon]|uniref:J domain-containing protein n=1 Tax=Xylaria hypoxylon TaxID=37992 RepID=A0A4Z0Z2J1_9PEZI|nr:hypothetical protein E0Z10_g3157 [Xylaria hypoxylon]